MLSDSDSETNDLHTLTINDHFAKAFQYRKEREELAKLKEKYGSDYSESGSSSDAGSEDSEDTEEDSDGEELTPAVDAAILRTLARIKQKDPAIYEGGRRVFEDRPGPDLPGRNSTSHVEEHTRTQDKAPATKPRTKEKSKPLTIREAALASVLTDADAHSRSPSPHPLTHTEEQALLRSETRAAFRDAIDSQTHEDDDDILIPRSRTRDEIELEEGEYRAFLEREVGEDLHSLVTVDTNEVIGASKALNIVADGDKKSESKKRKRGKKEWEKEKDEVQGKKDIEKRDKKSKEEADREFLMNYIFNRGWIDRSNRRVPTYDEIVDSPSKQSKRKSTKSQADSDIDQDSADNAGAQAVTLSDEDSFDDLADAFETSYNFRFEEPGGALITSFPRDLPSVRRDSTTRKDARARKKERQEAEKQALLETRREEIRRERALVEAAVAEGDRDNCTLVVERDASKKKSKRQQRKEELARLKALEANELRRKLEMVSSEGGLGGIGDEALAHLDLDADWDPSKHDAQMAELYGGDDIVDDDDAEKPTWDDDINIDDIDPPVSTRSKTELKKQRKKEKKKNKRVEGEDVGVDVDEMDADVVAEVGWDDDNEEWRGTEEERKRKVDAYMDEVVHRLGFSGITSHMPTRFHYTSVAPENYGLMPAEVLLATDAELNSYVGLKKMAPYRVDRGGKAKKNWDPKRIQRLKEFRENLHSRAGSRYEGSWSLGGDTDAKNKATEAQREKKKRKGKKERAKLKATQGERGEEDDGKNVNIQPKAEVKSQKRKRDCDASSHPTPLSDEAESVIEDDAPKKKRRRQHKASRGNEADATAGVS